MNHYEHELRIGIVGHPSSGKDTLAAYLVEQHGFVHVSTGDLVRFYIAEHDLGEATRDLLHTVSNQLRREHGADYLVHLSLQTPARQLAVSGMRTAAEVTTFKAAGGVVVACTAPLELRYERARERGRVGDEVTFEMFREQEAAETTSTDPSAQNVSAVLSMADFKINNDGTLADLHREAEAILAKADSHR